MWEGERIEKGNQRLCCECGHVWDLHLHHTDASVYNGVCFCFVVICVDIYLSVCVLVHGVGSLCGHDHDECISFAIEYGLWACVVVFYVQDMKVQCR